MGVWQIMKSELPVADDPLFDDGHPDLPGEPAFSTAEVAAHVQGLGSAADGFNYVGPSPQ
jgi:hypothetical protein